MSEQKKHFPGLGVRATVQVFESVHGGSSRILFFWDTLYNQKKMTGSPSQTRTLANELQNRVSQKKSPLKFIYNQTVHTNGNDLPWEVMQEKCQH